MGIYCARLITLLAFGKQTCVCFLALSKSRQQKHLSSSTQQLAQLMALLTPSIPSSHTHTPWAQVAAVAHKNGNDENENLTTAQRDALFVCAAFASCLCLCLCPLSPCLSLWPCLRLPSFGTRRFPGLASGLPFSSFCLSACSKLAADSRRQKLLLLACLPACLLACRLTDWLAGWLELPPISYLPPSSALPADGHRTLLPF